MLICAIVIDLTWISIVAVNGMRYWWVIYLILLIPDKDAANQAQHGETPWIDYMQTKGKFAMVTTDQEQQTLWWITDSAKRETQNQKVCAMSRRLQKEADEKLDLINTWTNVSSISIPESQKYYVYVLELQRLKRWLKLQIVLNYVFNIHRSSRG